MEANKIVMIRTLTKYNLHFIPFIITIIYLLLIRWQFIFSYSIDLDGLEYYFFRIIQEMQQGKSMYSDPMEFPYSINLYTPVYFYVLSSLVSVFKLNIYNDLHEILITGRILSFFTVLLQILFLIKLIKKITQSNFIAVLIVALYILLISGHMYAVRPDAFKAFLFILFVYYLTEYLFFSNKILNAFFCICSSVLAVYSKQDISVYISLLYFIVLIFIPGRKTITLFITFHAICFILFILMWFIYGKSIFSNLVLFNLQSLKVIESSYNVLLFIFSIIRTFPLILLALYNYKEQHDRDKSFNFFKLLAIAPVFFYPFIILSLFRPGANINYTYELCVLLVLNIAVFISANKEQIQKRIVLFTVLLSGYIGILFFTNALINSYHFDNKKEAVNKKDYFTCMQERDSIKKIIQNDTVFFPNTKYTLYFADKNVVLGHDMHLDRFINLYTDVQIQSKLLFINTDKYDNNFKDGTVKYIIIYNDSKSLNHIKKYYPNYYFYTSIGHFRLYKYSTEQFNHN